MTTSIYLDRVDKEWDNFFTDKSITESSQKTIWKDQTGFIVTEAQTVFNNGWTNLTINSATDGTGVITDISDKKWNYASHGKPAKPVNPLTDKKSDLDNANKNSLNTPPSNLDKATNADIENAKQGKSDTAKRFLETLKNRNQTAGLSLSRSSQFQSLPDNSNKIELAELVKIVGWIENAKLSINKKNYNESALLKLGKIKSGNSSHEVKINNFKENDGDDKSWLEKCLNIWLKILFNLPRTKQKLK